VLGVSGDTGLTIPTSPFNVVQSGAVALSGALTTQWNIPPAGAVQYLTPLGAVLSHYLNFQALMPTGEIVNEQFFVTVPFDLNNNASEFGLILTLAGVVHPIGDPTGSVTVGFNVAQLGGLLVTGTLDLLDTVFATAVKPAQFLTPLGEILSKTRAIEALTPMGGIIDESFVVLGFELAPTSALGLTGALKINGNVQAGTGVADTSFDVESPLALGTPIQGALGVIGDVQAGVAGASFDVEAGLILDTVLQAVLGVTGDVEIGTGVGVLDFAQVGAFTVHGALGVIGDTGLTLGPAIPFEVTGTIGVTGVLKVAGQFATAVGFNILTQPIGINGALLLRGDVQYPSVVGITQVGDITLQGLLAFRDTAFRYEAFTEGLPRGWYVDGPILETVPNPNYGTAYGNAFFRRWTWKGYDPAGTMVAASGSEQDCIAQTLSVCQSRHEDWKALAR
jgi:hypothetical protein